MTRFGLSSRAYEISPGDLAPDVDEPGQVAGGKEIPDPPLTDPDQPSGHYPARIACWELEGAFEADVPGAPIDTEVIVARNTQTQDLAVAFRGTESLDDVGTDLTAARTSTSTPTT